MDLNLLRCFETAATELHFGRAARRLDLLPATLGRNIRLLEEQLGLRLFLRSTRFIALTRPGEVLLHEARALLAHADHAVRSARAAAADSERVFRIGAIDSAATGLMPPLMHDFKQVMPGVGLMLTEDKTVRLLPKLLSGALDIAFVRPPSVAKPEIEFALLLNEATVVALPSQHRLAQQDLISVRDLDAEPLIVSSPRIRPHSYNLTMGVFARAGLQPNVVQQAEEKQTIVNLVGARIGAALVPYWTSRNAVDGVVYRPLVDHEGRAVRELPLAAAWVRGVHSELRDAFFRVLRSNLDRYAR